MLTMLKRWFGRADEANTDTEVESLYWLIDHKYWDHVTDSLGRTLQYPTRVQLDAIDAMCSRRPVEALELYRKLPAIKDGELPYQHSQYGNTTERRHWVLVTLQLVSAIIDAEATMDSSVAIDLLKSVDLWAKEYHRRDDVDHLYRRYFCKT